MALLKKFLVIIILLSFSALSLCGCKENKNIEITTDDVKIIAHRGLSSKFYQNTYEAFSAAGKSDYFYGIETDVRLTLDNVWVCSHDNDPFTDKTKFIDSLNYSEAIVLPLNPDKKGYEGISGEFFLCDFSKYIDVCSENNKMPVIEIKCNPDNNQLQNLLDIIEKKINLDKVLFICFQSDNLDKLIEINGSLNIMTLTFNQFTAIALSIKGKNFGISYEILSKNLIKQAHSKGAVIDVFTVNDKVKINEYKDMCVDYITTDYDFSEE